VAAPKLGRLIAPDGLEALLVAATAVGPGVAARVIDRDGVELARSGPAADGEPGETRDAGGAGDAAGADAGGADAGGARGAGGAADPEPFGESVATATEPLVVDGATVGSVTIRAADEAVARSVAGLVGRAIELAAAEGLSRRAVTAAAIDDLRELSLLSRLSETIGSEVDPAGIAGCVLSTVARPLGPATGLVLGPDDVATLAASGPDELIAALREAAAPLIARLRAEDPAIGSCAEVAAPSDARFGTILAAFLRTARGHHGTIMLGRAAGGADFTAADRQLLASVAGQAALAIERVALQRQLVARHALDQELAIGRRIQISLMPRRFPTLDGWEIASAYEPAREVGGDFYDVFRLRERGACIGLVVGDVTGKGIPAAILMADARGLIHAAADHLDDPAETLQRVNRILVDERASGLFVTVAHAVLDPATGRLVLARAGHDPVHVLRADGRLEILLPPGRLIGMVADVEATSVELALEPGDAIVIHSDGVTEARAEDGSFYGEERLRALLGGLVGVPAAAIVDAVVADVASFRSRAEPSDDLTLLVARRQATIAG
jgi:serine phosphatase RsbU (regulator of sigma subunit)